MQQVRELYCASPGLPRTADLDWRRAVLGTVSRSDPFTGREVVAADWQAAEAATATASARVYERVVLSAADEWAPAARVLAAHHAALHDGHLVELWSLAVGDAQAQAAWAPSFITPDRESQILTFPVDVTRWLASAEANVIAEAVGRWAELPYLEAAGGEHVGVIAECAFRILVPLAARRVSFTSPPMPRVRVARPMPATARHRAAREAGRPCARLIRTSSAPSGHLSPHPDMRSAHPDT